MSIRTTILGGLAPLLFGVGIMLSGVVHADSGDAPNEQVWLSAHNAERAEFGVAPLNWNPRLAQEARTWAHRLAREEALRHASTGERGGRGENLWMGTAGYYSAAQMVGYFVDEKRHFRAGEFPLVSRTGNWADVGHYTQIVWADTREVGCATARGPRFDVLVCRYWPSGNVMGTHIAPQRHVARR